MPKPVLYLDVVGTLLVEKSGDLDVAPFARSFIEATKRTFEIRLLTTLEAHQVLRVQRTLLFEARHVPYRVALGKTSAIDFEELFFWVDDEPLSDDILRLSDARCSERLIPVSRREGVTEATLRKLLSTLKEVTAQKAAEGGAATG